VADIWTWDGFKQLDVQFYLLESAVIFCEDLVTDRLTNVKACGYDGIIKAARRRGAVAQLGYLLCDRGIGVRFPAGEKGIFLFSTVFRQALGPTQLPLQVSLLGYNPVGP
jgi:hypothetical protein